MTANTYSEFTFYSPIYDCECARVSVSDGRTGEYFVIMPHPGYGKSLRLRREKALAAIESHIDAGLPLGEVSVDFSETQT